MDPFSRAGTVKKAVVALFLGFLTGMVGIRQYADSTGADVLWYAIVSGIGLTAGAVLLVRALRGR